MLRPSGQMDKASVSGAEDWGFESPLGCEFWLLRGTVTWGSVKSVPKTATALVV